MVTRRDFLKTSALAGAGFLVFKGSTGKLWACDTPNLRKFISPLPGLGPGGIPIATADTKTFPGADFYRLAATEFRQQMHPDLPGETKLWGYTDLTRSVNQAYLGPLIIAKRDRPVIIRMSNQLPPKHPLPVDTTLMGADMGAAQNRIALHLHGGFVPWSSDGGPFAWYDPAGKGGASFVNGTPGQPGSADYYYPNQQSARLMWYHDHAMGITRLNAYAGLAAGYLLTDDVEAMLTSGSAPTVPTVQVPLIIQEKAFKCIPDEWGNPGDLWYKADYDPADLGPGMYPPLPYPSCIPEFFGDTPVVNGMCYPYLEVQPRRYRFRILNGSQARFFNLQLYYADNTGLNADVKKPGPAFIQIGTEGGFLPYPVVLNDPRAMGHALSIGFDPITGLANRYNLLLAPAERADIIIDFSKVPRGARLILYNDAPAPFPGGDPANDYDDPGTPNTRTLMQFRVVPLTGAPDPLDFAKTLFALQSALPSAYVASHAKEPDLSPKGQIIDSKTLNEDYDDYGRLLQRLGTAELPPGADSYGRAYMDQPTEVVHAGEIRVWDIYNTTMDTHPMHFHLVNVQVMGRAPFAIVGTPGGRFVPPDANERGWKETVRMNPGQVTRVIMRFALPQVPFAVRPSPRLLKDYQMNGSEYVWHCHILEHEEHDMMRPLVVL